MSDRGLSSYPIPLAPPSRDAIRRRPDAVFSDDVHLCSVLERIADPGSALAAYRGTLYGLPWFTPIIGSGCLQMGDGPTLDLAALKAGVTDFVERLGMENPLLPALVEEFVSALYQSQTHEPLEPESLGSVAPEPSASEPPVRSDLAWAPRLATYTAMLTRLYHSAAAAHASPVSRNWLSDRVALYEVPDTALRDNAVRVGYHLIEHPIESPNFRALEALLEDVQDDLTRRLRESISVANLRLLTEMTWIELTSGTSIYPDWSELLLKLAETSDSGLPVTGSRLRINRLRNIDESVARLLTPPTIRSWIGRRHRTGAQMRNRFYDAVADALHAEARIHALLHPEDAGTDSDEDYAQFLDRTERVNELLNRVGADMTRRLRDEIVPGSATPSVPHPVAYVTSFDLELEMALWSRGEPFRLVTPAFASTQGRDADLVWLSALVDPAKDRSLGLIDGYRPLSGGPAGEGEPLADLDCLRAARRSWQVAERAVGGGSGPDSGGDHPVVVRVTGSPLMKLPPATKLQEDLTRHLGLPEGDRPDLEHALAIDEYSAVREAEHELYFAALGKPRGLPPGLSHDTPSSRRVWVGFGVQVDDAAIRLRMFVQLSAASIQARTVHHFKHRSPADERVMGQVVARREPEHVSDGAQFAERSNPLRVRGIAVNRRIDEELSASLRWLGFEFAVDESAGDLTPDIAHCARHYEHVCECLQSVMDVGLPTGDDGQPENIDWGRPFDEICPLARRMGPS